MSEDFSTGVTESAQDSGTMADTSPAASPAAEAQAQAADFAGAPVEQIAQPAQPATTEGAGTAPAVPEADPDEGIEPDQLTDEKARNAFIHLRQQKQDAKELRTVVEPLFTEAATAFGVEWQNANPDERRAIVAAVQTDHKMVSSLYGETPEARIEFFNHLYQQSPEAYQRLETDLAGNQRMQALVLQQLGLEPEEMPKAAEWLKSGAWRNQPQAEAAQFNEATLTDIADPAMQAVYKALDKAGRDYADSLYGDDLANFLRRENQAQSLIKGEADRRQAEAEAQREQFQQAVTERKEATYQSVRNIVKDSLARLFPNNEEALSLVMAAAESRLYGSEEGAALWHELEGCIERGEQRKLQEKMPQMVAKARAIATETAKYLNERESKARQLDDLMRMGSQEEIYRYLAQARGGQAQLPNGERPAGNGHNNVPEPSRVGRYEPANILSYFPRQ